MASSAWLAAQAIRNRRPAVTWAAVPGALCIIGAAVNGASFLDYNNNVNSYLMALLFAAAVLCYAVILAPPPAQNDQTPYFAASPDMQKAKSHPPRRDPPSTDVRAERRLFARLPPERRARSAISAELVGQPRFASWLAIAESW